MKNFRADLKKWVCACFALMPMVATAQTVNVDLSKEYQLIKGFGGINFPTWIDDLSASQRETAFGNDEGQLGLSVLRIHVDPEESNWSKEVATAQNAVKKGVTVFASPWSPPSSMCEPYQSSKRLKTSSYGAYVQHLNKFIDYMKQNGVDLYAMSIQNEPDYGSDWTWWPSNDMATFMANYAQDIKCRVMAPESFQYTKSTSDPILNNSKALANLDILATHLYGTQVNQFSYPLFQQKGAGKELWMTEVYYPNSSSDADTWPEALEVADHMTNAVVRGNFQTYVWWYIRRYYSLIKDNGNVTKRGYCFAQYSKFVRPGFVRVDATQNPTNNVNISAFKKDNDIVLVLVNKNTSSKTLTISIPGSQIASWERYVTSGQKNVKKEEDVNGGTSFQITLEAQSATTLVGGGKKGTPKVSFTSPTASDDLEAPATVTLSVDATDEDGSIRSVAFYNGDTKLGESTSAPYTYTIEGLKEGTYTLSAVATDNEGNEGKSTVTVTVHVPQTPYKGTPSVLPGKIEVEEYDLGGSGIAYSDAEEENKGKANFRTNEGVDVEKCGDGMAIGYTNEGEWLEYTVDVKKTDTYKWSARVASGSDGSSFHLMIDGKEITSTIKVPNGGDWDTYTVIEGKTSQIEEGTHVLKLVIDGNYANVDWLQFEAESGFESGLANTGNLQSIQGTFSIIDMNGKVLGNIDINPGDDVSFLLQAKGFRTGIYLLSNEDTSLKIEVK
ncbi:MAG: carbohydrate-binding protein [Paludibacteraceae bacterium]|nr:carbohydrate-binding protein [Paludibacteraceae bacterium]